MVVPLRGFNMAYIAPNSVVELFYGISLDPTYSDTLYFGTNNLKDAYFETSLFTNTYLLGRFTALSYNREERGFCRIQAPMAQVINANYMRFKNTSFENKWFYAFVTNVEYINNEVSQINFEIDYMMTWMGSFILEECYVVRNHTASDVFGEWLEPEPFTFNDYVYNGKEALLPNGNVEMNYAVVIMSAFSGLSEQTSGRYIEGVYNGLNVKAYAYEDLTGINQHINSFVNPDSIINMYMCKAVAVTPSGVIDSGGMTVPSSTRGTRTTVSLTPISTLNDTLDGYLPKNKKLYTFPYTFCSIDNGQGASIIMRYEYCGTSRTPQVQVSYNCITPVSETLRPYNYRGCGGNIDSSMALTLCGAPLCSWVSDAFKAWVAQNSVNYSVDIAKTGLYAGLGMFGTAAKTGIETATDAIKSAYTASIEPDIVKGTVANGANIYNSGYYCFNYGRMSINHDVAQMVDKYFDLYGYAQNRLRQPSMNNRPHWTYLQTSGCHIHGNLPADHAAKIESIIDNGCRFWKDVSEIGNYSMLNNSPGGG